MLNNINSQEKPKPKPAGWHQAECRNWRPHTCCWGGHSAAVPLTATEWTSMSAGRHTVKTKENLYAHRLLGDTYRQSPKGKDSSDVHRQMGKQTGSIHPVERPPAMRRNKTLMLAERQMSPEDTVSDRRQSPKVANHRIPSMELSRRGKPQSPKAKCWLPRDRVRTTVRSRGDNVLH